MSKDIVYINAFGRRFTVKKSNKNMRLSYAYYTNLSNKNKHMMAVADETDNVETKDMGDREIAEQIMNSFDSASKAALDLQNVPINYIKEILKLNPKQVSMLDDMTGPETGALAGRIAHGITSDDEDIDPKKPRRRNK
ncbi:hypothetical protein [Companilactobacillus nantensis]|uniref:Uncharacterized protein n=1 Tax=Companilactobacillus nantensis DSM 16982 TaxID=1423774 RepID=A0A0R1WJG9_9LACO|nr:hypothetical protein [Companilactobacillus nantensis]KRM15913.1 hypothetical protein FD31_GL000808 [Companilactobacillus nantensis DSM 16982]GEO64774.1 hypothetical protein LNA01_19570 [Companilactobacillus nantensis]